MENMGLKYFQDVYSGRRVTITGHTGFKGSWLALWLNRLGAKIQGISLDPETDNNHWNLLNLRITEDIRMDIRDSEKLQRVINKFQPEIIFHLAAQSLVRKSYNAPYDTFSTNLMGTVNILESLRVVPSIKAAVIVTTDKCYENKEWIWAYRENDALGGNDPYSASKSCAEFAIHSYRSTYFHSSGSTLIASARAGNVIGGGDWAEDRLIPDIVRAIEQNEPVRIRFPEATRPWQHVLEPLQGYLMLGERLLKGDRTFAEAWNFGPDDKSNCSVSEVLENFQKHWIDLRWNHTGEHLKPETRLLNVDSTKAKSVLRWKPVWDFSVTIEKTAEWYKTFKNESRPISSGQLDDYIQMLYGNDEVSG